MNLLPHVTHLFIYPVKSLGGIELTQSAVESRGLRHDRRWMVTDENGMFLTQRKFPRMALARVQLAADHLVIEAPRMPALTAPFVLTEPEELDVQIWRSVCRAQAVGREADLWFTEFLGFPSRLVFMPDSSRRETNPDYSQPGDIVSFSDGYPVLAIGEASLAELNSRLERPLPMDRFRPNIVVTGTPAFAEDRWTRVETGEASFRGANPCARCTVTTTDQSTGAVEGPEPLRTLASYRRDAEGGVLFGQNLLVDREGTVRVGDRLTTHS